MTYIVTAPLVIAADRDGHNHHVYRGGQIGWLSDAQAEHFLSEGLVEKVRGGDAVLVDGGPIGALPADAPDPAAVVDNPPPAKAAPKADWVDYAVSRGWDRDEAEATSKADLVEALG